MGEVIDLDSKRPHLSGQAVCMECGNNWVAVAPVGVHELECPSCKLMKGVFAYQIVGETFWECNCGCRYYSVSGITQNILCVKCGTVQVIG